MQYAGHYISFQEVKLLDNRQLKAGLKWVFDVGRLYIRDYRQVTFVTLNGFCPLSTPSLLLTNNIKMDRIPPKVN